MNTIKAKPITNNYWILRQNDKKIGQITLDINGYDVNINGNRGNFKSKNDLDMIEFINIPKPEPAESTMHEVHGFPTNSIAFNAVWNLKYNLPLFTTGPNSKCWHAAGYYIITIKGKKIVELCPKLISVQRNHYIGPFNKKPVSQFEKLYDCN